MGWFVVTVAIPVLAPMWGMALYKFLRLPAEVGDHAKFILTVKDGQLGWVAVGFCASGLYELFEGSQTLGHAMTGWAEGGFMLILVSSAFYAASGAVFPTPVPAPDDVKWSRHYVTMVASAALTFLAAFAYTVVHFQVSNS